MALLPDLGIDGIDDLALLNCGGSPIYRARETRDHRLVAIRILNDSDRPLLPPRRFDPRRRPLHSFARADGVVPVCRTGATRTGERYLMMPFYPAGSLADQLTHGSTPWHASAELIVRVAEVLAAGHRAGVVLTGIEPSSILLANATSPLLAVYGMATRPRDDGKPSYRAPELDHGADPEPPADVYSLGLTAAALISGQAPSFDVRRHELVSNVEGSAPDRIVEVVARATAERPVDRFRDAGELAVRLRAAIDGQEIPDRPPPPGGAASAGSIDLELVDLLGPASPLEALAELRTGTSGTAGSADPDVRRSPPPLPSPAFALTPVAVGTADAPGPVAAAPIIDLTDSAPRTVASPPVSRPRFIDSEVLPFRTPDRQYLLDGRATRSGRRLEPLRSAGQQIRRSLGSLLAILALLVVAGIVFTIGLQQRQAAPSGGAGATALTGQDGSDRSTLPPTSLAVGP